MVPLVGASGAISAVMGAYIVLFPSSRIKTFIFFFFFNIPAYIFLGLWIGQQIINGIYSIGGQNAGGGGVAWWAHVGGFAFGFLFGYYLKRNFPEDSLYKNGERHDSESSSFPER
jgi:membrane associated rhomboid family serine protease